MQTFTQCGKKEEAWQDGQKQTRKWNGGPEMKWNTDEKKPSFQALNATTVYKQIKVSEIVVLSVRVVIARYCVERYWRALLMFPVYWYRASLLLHNALEATGFAW